MPNVAFNVDYEDFLSIQGKNSHFNMYYQIDTPFSFVLETYDDKSDEAYINMASFTPNNIKHTVVKDPAKIMAAQNRCLHQHDFYELMFVLEGKVINCIENTQHIYTKGSGCLLNRNLRHAEKFEGSFRVFFLTFQKSLFNLC